MKHLRYLSEDIGPRIGGTSSERRAADYIAKELAHHGYRVELEPFAVADKFLAQLSSPAGLPTDLNWQAGAWRTPRWTPRSAATWSTWARAHPRTTPRPLPARSC